MRYYLKIPLSVPYTLRARVVILSAINLLYQIIFSNSVAASFWSLVHEPVFPSLVLSLTHIDIRS